MPIYEFKCHKCEKVVNKLAKVADYNSLETRTCPHCGKEMTRIFLTAPGVYCHGCPSYQFKRESNEVSLEKETNKRLNEQNMAEISESMNRWEIREGAEPAAEGGICPVAP